MMDPKSGITALKVGAWGGLALGLVMTTLTLFSYGTSQPIRLIGGGSVLLIGAAFWLFLKNTEAHDGE